MTTVRDVSLTSFLASVPLAVAQCYRDCRVGHTLPLGDLGEIGEEFEEDKSLQNSGSSGGVVVNIKG